VTALSAAVSLLLVARVLLVARSGSVVALGKPVREVLCASTLALALTVPAGTCVFRPAARLSCPLVLVVLVVLLRFSAVLVATLRLRLPMALRLPPAAPCR